MEIEIDSATYSEKSFIGKLYKNALPNSIKAAFIDGFKGLVARCSQNFFPSFGTFSFTVSKNRKFIIGQKILASTSYIDAAATAIFDGYVVGYDPSVGALTVRIECIRDNALAMYNRFYFIGNVRALATMTNSLANRLTASTTLSNACYALKRGLFGNQYYNFDFNGNFDGPVYGVSLPEPYYVALNGTSSLTGWNKSAPNTTENEVSRVLLTAGALDRIALYVGRNPWIYWDSSSLFGNFLIRTPATLSDAGNSYRITLGFKGYGSTEAAPLLHSGFGATYNHGENAGQWILRTGNNGAAATVNSAVAVAAATVTRLSLQCEGSTIRLYVNGTLAASQFLSVSTNVNNYLHPFVMIESLVGASRAMWWDQLVLGGT